MSYNLDICNFFFTIFVWSKNQIWENRFWGQKKFPDFRAQIGLQHFFIIWQDGQMPYQLFFTNINPNIPPCKNLYTIFCCFWANDPL